MKRESTSREYISLLLLLLAAWIFVSVLEALYAYSGLQDR
jgi:hypothetical protein